MSNLNLPNVTDYASADACLGDLSDKRVAYATDLVRNGQAIQVLHHGSPIITYWADGTLDLDPYGWHSRTTADRLHRLTPHGVRVNLRGTGSENYDPRTMITTVNGVVELRGHQALRIWGER